MVAGTLTTLGLAKRLGIVTGGGLPPLPTGFQFLKGADGAYLKGADGAYLYGRAA